MTSESKTPERVGPGRLIVLTAVIAFGFITLPGAYSPIRPGLDASWQYAINYLPQSDQVYGRDIAFTYGPLGYVLFPMNVGQSMALALGFRLIVHMVFCTALLHCALVVSGGYQTLMFILVHLFATTLGLPYESHLVVFAGLLAVISLHGGPAARLTVPITAAFTAVCVLIKPTTAVAVMAIVFFSEAARIAKGKTTILGTLTSALLPFALVLVSVSYVFFESWENFATWCRANYEFARYNNVAMSLEGPRSVLIAGLACLGMYTGLTGLLLLRRSRLFSTCLMLLPALVIAFKHGFDRQDAHVLVFFTVFAAAFALPLLMCREPRDLGLVLVTYLAGILLVVPVAETHRGILHSRTVDLVSGKTAWHNLACLSDLQGTSRMLDKQAGESLAALQLPPAWSDTIRQIGGGVDVMPWEIVYCPANGLPWRPSPTVQTYITYTAWLDNWNARHFRGGRAPQFLLLKWEDIDNRLIPFDVPATWRTILLNYDVIDIEPGQGLLLLSKRMEAVRPVTVAKSRITVKPEEWAMVPDSDDLVFAHINMSLNGKGKLAKMFFRVPPIMLELNSEDGDTYSYRIIPDTARNGLVISHALDGPDDVLALFSDMPTERIGGFRVTGPGASYLEDEISVEFSVLPHGSQEPSRLAMLPSAWGY